MTDELDRQPPLAAFGPPPDAYPLTPRAEIDECRRILAGREDEPWL